MTASPFAFARALRAGETVCAAWCTLGSPIVAEIIAREGLPGVVLDIQHGLWDTAAVVAACGAVTAAKSAPIVRVPVGDMGFVSRALDVGAQAIIAPMINTAGDARAFAAHAKYPALGERSWGPHRAISLQGFTGLATDYITAANDGTLTMAMIETPLALSNVDAIAATPGIDALFVGPYDLSTTLSKGKAQDITAPEVEKAIDAICAAAIKAGKIPGIFCSDPARGRAMAARGFRFITIGADIGLVRNGAAAMMKAFKA